MSISPSQYPQYNSISQRHGTLDTPSDHNHGLLLLLPKENLTHITSYLDPRTLLLVGQVNWRLYEHIKDDHTWRRAFAATFLGIAPEKDLETDESFSLLFRRSESTWRKEYIVHYVLSERWARSRNAVIAHTPVHSYINSIHLMSNSVDSILSSSLQYGVVSRSLPLTGKVLRGYLSPLGAGIGIGNPNVEFAPDVTACDITSDGGTAKVAWGFRSGFITISTAAKAMDKGRPAAKTYQCQLNEKHERSVECIAWDKSGTLVFSGSNDGVVKVWDSKTTQCLWSSPPCLQSDGVPNSATLIAGSVKQSLVVCGYQNGDIIAWTWLPTEDTLPLTIINTVHFPSPVAAGEPSLYVSLHIDPNTSSILVAYWNQRGFFRLNIEDGSLVAFSSDYITSSIFPVFAQKPGDRPFILVGDTLGSISVVPWSMSSSESTRTLAACDSAVTCIHWDGITMVAGSAGSEVTVVDALSFNALRKFAMGRIGIGSIAVSRSRDTLFAVSHSQVHAWKAGPVPRGGPQKVIRSGKNPHPIKSKAYDSYQLKKMVSESMFEMDMEKVAVQRSYGREREQQQNLDQLGLDEAEAVEYVLMLSREEALASGAQGQAESFESSTNFSSSRRASRTPSPPSPSRSRSDYGLTGKPIAVAPKGKGKAQILPGRREPRQAGLDGSGNPSSSRQGTPASVWGSPSKRDDFPTVSTSISPPRVSPPGHSAWNSPLKTARASVADTPVSETSIDARSREEQEEEDLRLAIELSLADVQI